MVFAEQVHGVAATVVGHAERGRGALRMDDAVASTDILVTSALDTTLAILVADCVPIALLDPEAGACRHSRRMAGDGVPGGLPGPRGDERVGRGA